MTIQGWVLFGILALFILSFGIFGAIIFEKIVWKVLGIVAAMLLIIGLFAGMRWYYQNTASGQRAMTDQKSELDNGLERTVTIYTADGEIIAQYDASPLRGGHPGGQIGQVYGIVEFKDGVRRIDPAKIKFCDDENAILAEMEKHNRAGKLEGQ